MAITTDPLAVMFVFLISTLGATLQGSVGFGLGFVAVPLLAFIDQRYLPGPLLLSALFLTMLLAFREHRAIQFNGIKWVISGRFIGSLVGAQLLVLVPRNQLALLFAVMVMIGVILSVSGLHLPMNNRNLLAGGSLSGLMSTTSAIGGPPLAMLYQYLNGPELRGTLSGIFMVGAVISLFFLVLVDRFGMIELKLSLILLPGIFTGYFLSKHTARILDRGFIRPAILLFSLLSGCVLLFNTIF
jgi:uncharacterized membrane protein YfcA